MFKRCLIKVYEGSVLNTPSAQLWNMHFCTASNQIVKGIYPCVKVQSISNSSLIWRGNEIKKRGIFWFKQVGSSIKFDRSWTSITSFRHWKSLFHNAFMFRSAMIKTVDDRSTSAVLSKASMELQHTCWCLLCGLYRQINNQDWLRIMTSITRASTGGAIIISISLRRRWGRSLRI